MRTKSITNIPSVVGSTNIGDASVSCQNYHWGSLTLQCSVQKGEALHIKHMHLVNEKHARHYFRFSLLSPLSYPFIDLLSNLLRYLSSSSRKQSQKSLRSRVYDINFMQCDGVNHFFSFFNLPLRTINKSCLWSHCIIITSPSETSSSFGDFSWCLIDSDNIAWNNFLFLDSFYHFLSKIIDSFHFGCF